MKQGRGWRAKGKDIAVFSSASINAATLRTPASSVSSMACRVFPAAAKKTAFAPLKGPSKVSALLRRTLVRQLHQIFAKVSSLSLNVVSECPEH
jgi:hypothetical protein